MLDERFMERLRNWLRWCKQKGFRRSQAGSIEGLYRSGQVWEPEEPHGEPVDVVDAAEVDRAYVALDDRSRRVIKILYFRDHWKPAWQAQKLNCRAADLDALRVAALRCLMVRLYPARQSAPAVLRPEGALLS